MKKYFLTALVSLMSAAAFAAWDMPSKQVSVRTNSFAYLGQTNVTTEFAPSNSLQAHLEWIDDHWEDGFFQTNKSYYYVTDTTQNLYNLIVRGSFLGVSGTFGSNLYVGNSAWITNDLWVGDDIFTGGDLTVSNNAYVRGNLTVNTNLVVSNNATIGGSLTVGSIVSTGSLSVAGNFIATNNDRAVSFLGYPKLTLATNAVTVTVTGGGTGITSPSDWALFFDNDLNNGSTGSIANTYTHFYEVDLGANYCGFIAIKATSTSPGAGSDAIYFGFCVPYLRSTGGGLAGTTTYNGGVLSAGSASNSLLITEAFSGRYVSITFVGSGGTSTYRINEITVYGTTNDYRNMGGF